MAILLGALTWLLTLFAIAIGALYLFFKKRYTYWEERKIPHTNPKFPMGDLYVSKNIGEVLCNLYLKYRNEKVLGMWLAHRPCLLVNDLEIIRRILVQDFHYFPDHGNYVNIKDDPLANHLFSLHGSQWRNLRAKLSPTFSSGKMKAMFPIIENISKNLQKTLEPLAAEEKIIEMKDMIGRFATDVIASCAYGIDTNSLENPDCMFRAMGKRMFRPSLDNMLRNTLAFFVPDVAKLFKLVQTDKKLSEFFMNVFKETVNYRETNEVKRNDFMQLLIQLKNKGIIDDIDNKDEKGDPFTLEAAAAQAFVFFLGGYETTSGALQFTMFELAKNQAIQDKLRKEIHDELKQSDGDMTYEGLFALKYMGMVLEESQRKYPQGALLTRECKTDYSIPEVDMVVEKGTLVLVTPYGIHNDPKFYPHPEIFDPERFTEEEKAKRHKFAYLPFGEGPRFCIGQRFAQLQMRAALFALISKFKFELCEKSPTTVILDPKSFLVTPLGGVHLKISLL